MSTVSNTGVEYVLGHSDHELERLERMGQFLSGLTRDLLVRAGIGPGMRVLDFGAGAGDVSLLVAELVGSGGEVVAVERSAEAVGHARMRLAARGVRNVRVVHGDESAIPEAMGGKPFDALVGRLVLLHQPDPVASFAHLAAFVKPGGIVAFHEIDMDGHTWSLPAHPLLERVLRLITETFCGAGVAYDIGSKLARGFDRAGITDRRIMREGPIEGPESHCFEFICRTARSLMPAMIKRGLVAENELDFDTLAQRMKEEAVHAQAFFTPIYLVAAFGRTASAAP